MFKAIPILICLFGVYLICKFQCEAKSLVSGKQNPFRTHSDDDDEFVAINVPALNSISTLVSKLLKSLVSLLNLGGDGFSLISKNVIPIVNLLLNSFSTLIQEALCSIGKAISAGNDINCVQLIQLLNNLIQTSLNTILAQLVALLTSSNITEDVIDLINSLLDKLETILDDVLDLVESIIDNLPDSCSPLVQEALDGLIKTLKSLIESIKQIDKLKCIECKL